MKTKTVTTIVFPKYVSMRNPGSKRGTALRLSEREEGDKPNEAVYVRDAGAWSIGAKYVKGVLTTCNARKHWPIELERNGNGKILVEISRARWKKDNEGYV